MIVILMMIFCVTVILYYYLKSLFYWKLRNIPGPTPLPFFGNIKKSILRQTHSASIYKDIYDEYPDSKVVGIFRMLEPALIIRDLDYIKQILVKDFELFPERGIELSKDGVGNNLFHTDIETWRILKSKVTSFVTRKQLKEMFPIVSKETDNLVKHILIESEHNVEFESYNLFRKYAMLSTTAALFNVDLNNMVNKDYLKELDESTFKLTIKEYIQFFAHIKTHIKTSIFGKVITKFCLNIVRQAVNDELNQQSDSNNIMNTLLDLKKKGHLKTDKNYDNDSMPLKVTDDLLASIVFIFFTAGYENAALMLSYAMYYLSVNIDVQDKLIKEIDDFTSNSDGNDDEITYEKLLEMSYLDMVSKETLRINPNTTALQRKAMEDYTFPDSGFTIEKGTTILISPLAIQRDEKYFPNPDKFDPERFSRENSKARHACAYLPYGAGPRSCFGFKFSVMMFKIYVVKILSKFTVSTTKDISKEFNPHRFLLVMDGGIHLKFTLRNRS